MHDRGEWNRAQVSSKNREGIINQRCSDQYTSAIIAARTQGCLDRPICNRNLGSADRNSFDRTRPTKVAGTLRRAVRSLRFAGILGGRHMECAYYFDFCRLRPIGLTLGGNGMLCNAPRKSPRKSRTACIHLRLGNNRTRGIVPDCPHKIFVVEIFVVEGSTEPERNCRKTRESLLSLWPPIAKIACFTSSLHHKSLFNRD